MKTPSPPPGSEPPDSTHEEAADPAPPREDTDSAGIPRAEGVEPNPTRQRITGANPFVRRPTAPREDLSRDRLARREERDREAARASARRARARKQSSLLSLMFLAIAVIVFLTSRVLTPTVVVHLDGGDGIVVINGEEAGPTGEVLRAPLGDASVMVVPTGEDVVVDPALRHVTFGYQWDPVVLRFSLIERVRSRTGSP